MTQPRYFYTDALAAAWMAKYHGMKFIDWHWDNEQFVFVSDEVDLPDSPPLYIHPDSLALLEPQVGDLLADGAFVVDKEDPFTSVGQVEINTVRAWLKTSQSFAIILRNNAAFIWPESEAV